MKPKFKNTLAWEQAQLLMQPAFIRVIDNLRKQLDTSTWQGTYQEIQTPYPGYQLHLTQGKESVTIDIWNLCFQICFLDYQPTLETETSTQEVEIDTSLIKETGEIAWQLLDDKTYHLIAQIFANLPL
jgi:hypothetical protein